MNQSPKTEYKLIRRFFLAWGSDFRVFPPQRLDYTAAMLCAHSGFERAGSLRHRSLDPLHHNRAWLREALPIFKRENVVRTPLDRYGNGSVISR